MKPVVVFLTLLLVLMIAFLNTGCQEEELSSAEVLSKSFDVLTDAHSYSLEMEAYQDIVIFRQYLFSNDYSALIKMIKEPLSAEADVEMRIEPLGLKENMKVYLVDDNYYYHLQDVGWILQDASSDMVMSGILEGPFRTIEMLKEVAPDAILMIEENGFYNISNNESHGFFDRYIKDDFTDQATMDMLSEIDSEIELEDLSPEDIVIADISYQLKICSESFFPYEEVLSFKIIIDIEDDEIILDQETALIYLEFDAFDSIIIPSDMIDSALPYEEIF